MGQATSPSGTFTARKAWLAEELSTCSPRKRADALPRAGVTPLCGAPAHSWKGPGAAGRAEQQGLGPRRS